MAKPKPLSIIEKIRLLKTYVDDMQTEHLDIKVDLDHISDKLRELESDLQNLNMMVQEGLDRI